jgi:UDP-N-acetylglucosamine diphosphorylase/glucosamine-1-phosphate N-acetyltransferase
MTYASTTPRPAAIFDDAQGELGPLCDLRPTFAVRTGALTTRERLILALGLRVESLFVPDRLAQLARLWTAAQSAPFRADHPCRVNQSPTGTGPVLAINGRCVVPPVEAIAKLRPGERVVESGSGDTIAALVEPERLGTIGLTGPVADAPGLRTVAELPAPALLSRPWHVRTFRDAALAIDLPLIASRIDSAPTPHGVTTFGEHDLDVHPAARVYPGVVLDREHGAIAIDDSAVVRPGVTIIGPASIGPHSTILDRAIIKGQTAVGPWCKVAGEVGGTIFHGFANKAHDGHLGDSWVGKWANLGAGTTNSNLLNTYAEVVARATPGGKNERTGQQFLGAVIGDHVKTAICTRIMTGAVVHTGAMIASTAPVSGCVGRFKWVTDSGATCFRLEKFLDIAKAVMARRKVTPEPAYLDALSALWRSENA